MDDTVVLDNSFEEYKDEVECIKNDNTYESYVDNSIDDTVILECGNEVDLSEFESIDNIVVTSESVDILEENTENLTNKNEDKSKKVFFKGIAIISSVCLTLGVGGLYLEKSEKARIEQLKENLPKSSSELGCLPGNIATFDGDAGNPSYIATVDNVAFFRNGYELGAYDENLEEPFTILTNTDGSEWPQNLNKYGDYIYYRGDGYKAKKYNRITNEISYVYGIDARQMIIMGDYMYYTYEGDDDRNNLFKLNLIDGSKEKILNMPIKIFSLNSTHLLYRRRHTDTIYLMNLKTKETNALNIDTDWKNGATWVALYENCILYIDKNDKSLYRVNLKGNDIDIESKEKIQENVYDFTLEGQYLYFIEGDYENSKLLVKDLLSNDIYYIDDNAKSINVDGGFMEYYTDEGSYINKFSPERYEKID